MQQELQKLLAMEWVSWFEQQLADVVESLMCFFIVENQNPGGGSNDNLSPPGGARNGKIT